MSLEIGEKVFHEHFGEGIVIVEGLDGLYLIYFFKESHQLHGLYNHCWWFWPREVAKCQSLRWIIGRRQQ